MSNVPKVGDPCKADPVEEGEFMYGTITKIDVENNLAYSDLDKWADREFCGDLPTRQDDNGFWIFDGF